MRTTQLWLGTYSSSLLARDTTQGNVVTSAAVPTYQLFGRRGVKKEPPRHAPLEERWRRYRNYRDTQRLFVISRVFKEFVSVIQLLECFSWRNPGQRHRRT